jgi:excinuclease UvrABC nuclease subunit
MTLDWKCKCFPFAGKQNNTPSIPNCGGIYVIAQTTKDKTIVKYVGKAEDLDVRQKQHWSDSEQNIDLKNFIQKTNFLCFYYAPVNTNDERDGIEAYLVNYYLPDFNFQDPLSQPIQVNLPF